MLRTKKFPLVQCFAVVLMLSVGCSKYVPVEGVILLDGQPLSKATINFVPAESTKGDGLREATALSKEDGRFSLKSGQHPGAIPGKYKVIVSKLTPPKGLENPKNIGEAIQATHQAKEALAEEFSDPKLTPLEIEVPSGGKTDIELTVQKRSD